jgi:predicted amidohydrolase
MMKAALVIKLSRADGDLDANLAEMESLVTQAARGGAELVLFPEYAATPGINYDDPSQDLPLGQPVPGPASRRLGVLAHDIAVYIAFGVLERQDGHLFDSGVLINPNGEIILKHRRIQPQWHSASADPQIYLQGDRLEAVHTPFGDIAIAICGDLFDDSILARVRQAAPDYLLWPISRGFEDGSFDQTRWDRQEEALYIARAAQTGATTLMVNQIDDPVLFEAPCFGGALVVSRSGDVAARWPLGKPGILRVDV